MRLRNQFLICVVSLTLALIVAITGCSQPASETASTQAPAAPTKAVQSAPAQAAAQPTIAPAPAAPYRLGVLLPLTGSYSVYGIDVKNGVDFVVDKINKSGGIKGLGGAKIEMVVGDDTADPKVALTEFERLVSKENVDAVIGPFATTVITALGPWADRYSVPMITVGGYGDDLFKQHVKYAVHIGPSQDRLTEPHLNNILDMVEEFKLPRDRILLFAPDSATYRAKGELYKTILTRRGYANNIVGEIYVPADSKDLSSPVLKAKGLKPDILVSDSPANLAPLMIRAMDAVEFFPAVWGESTAIFDPKVRQAVSEAMWTKVTRRAGVLTYDYDHPEVPLPGVQAFRKEIEPWLKERNQVYTTRVPYGQAVYALAKVLDDIKTKDKAKVNDALHKMSIKDTDPQFIAAQFGPSLEWTADGEPKNFRLLGVQYQVQNGQEKQALLYPKSVRPAGATPWVK